MHHPGVYQLLLVSACLLRSVSLSLASDLFSFYGKIEAVKGFMLYARHGRSGFESIRLSATVFELPTFHPQLFSCLEGKTSHQYVSLLIIAV